MGSLSYVDATQLFLFFSPHSRVTVEVLALPEGSGDLDDGQRTEILNPDKIEVLLIWKSTMQVLN